MLVFCHLLIIDSGGTQSAHSAAFSDLQTESTWVAVNRPHILCWFWRLARTIQKGEECRGPQLSHKPAPSMANANEQVFKHLSIHWDLDGGSSNASFVWCGSNRQLLPYLADEVIDDLFFCWNRGNKSVSSQTTQKTSRTNKVNSLLFMIYSPLSEDQA